MRVKKWVGEALQVLSGLGIPIDGMTARRTERMAKAFLAVAALKPSMAWRDVTAWRFRGSIKRRCFPSRKQERKV